MLTLVNALPDDVRPMLDGDRSAEPHTYGIDAVATMKALHDLPEVGADGNEAAMTAGARGTAQTTEPPPGTPEFEEADQQAREVERPSWNDLSFLRQLGVEFERFNEQGKARGATLGIDSAARRVQQVQEFQRLQDAGAPLTLVQKQYLLRNRRAASDLAKSVSQLVEAQRHLDRLPANSALRDFFGAPTAEEAGRLLREKPGEIIKALGIASVPDLTLGLIASALGPVGSGLAVAGTSGLEGWANGLIGALAAEGVDVSDAGELTAAVQDKGLMDRVHEKSDNRRRNPARHLTRGHDWWRGPGEEASEAA